MNPYVSQSGRAPRPSLVEESGAWGSGGMVFGGGISASVTMAA